MGKNKESAKPGEKADISRIPPPIPLRLSKKVLEKYKYYKGKGVTINASWIQHGLG